MFFFTQLLLALFFVYEYYLQNKKFSFCGHYCKEKQRLKMTHLFFYLELKTKTQGHITNNIYHYKMKVVFVNQDNPFQTTPFASRFPPGLDQAGGARWGISEEGFDRTFD